MNPADEEWGEENLMQVVARNIALPAAEQLSHIIVAADAFAAGTKQHDDMTLVVLRVES
jgi:serine phosphatase RsbU (regulator of sigma subunit)